MRDQFLQSKFTALLGRLSPPQAIRSSEALQADEIASLVSSVKSTAPRDGYEEWWPRFEASLLDLMQTRAWPTRNEIKRAAASVGGGPELSDADLFSAKVDNARSWLSTNRKCPHWVTDYAITRALLDEGRFENEREARFLGWPLSTEDERKAIGRPSGDGPWREGQQRMGMEEWQHHIKVMSELTGKPEHEVAAQEREVLSPAELPAGMIYEAAQ